MMPTLKPVHKKEGARIVEHNPIRQFRGHGPRGTVFQHQGGQWFDALGAHLREDQVPEELREFVATHPLKAQPIGTRTVEVCDHCGETFFADELRAHLLEAWKEATKVAAPPEAPGLASDSIDIPPAIAAL